MRRALLWLLWLGLLAGMLALYIGWLLFMRAHGMTFA